MKIEYHKRFQKSLKKLERKIQVKVIERIECFQKDPLNPFLHNHPLKVSMLGKRAFSVMGDLRIIFEDHENYPLVLMLDVVTHNQVCPS